MKWVLLYAHFTDEQTKVGFYYIPILYTSKKRHKKVSHFPSLYNQELVKLVVFEQYRQAAPKLFLTFTLNCLVKVRATYLRNFLT